LVRLLEDASTDDTTKSNAARALCLFADANENNRVAVAAAGAIPPLVELLRGGSDEGRAEAAEALWILAYSDDDNDAVTPLVELLSGGSDEGRAEAARALGNLAYDDDIAVVVVAAGAIPPLVELLSGSSDNGMAIAAGALRIIAWGNNANVTAVVAAGAPSPLVELLSGKGPRRGGGSPRGRCSFSHATTRGGAKLWDSDTPNTV
jgi:vacuolar protein 8